MEQRITIEPVAFPTDHRGLVLEPIGPDALPRQQNVHLALTLPGHVRGNHYHLRGSEVAVVLGPALFRYREGGEARDLHVAEGQAFRLRIPPGVPHAFQNPGPGPMIIVAFNTVVHDPEHPDVVREVLIET
jgi:dTDP-4-dehydrorhamnose 3,5-epimerase-like enzyme